MSTVHDPFAFFIGDTWEIELSAMDGDGNPLDLTGATVEWKLDDAARRNVHTITSPDDNLRLIIAAPTTGVVLLRLPADDTADLIEGAYLDQWRVTGRDGVVSTQATGRIDVKATLP